MDDADRAEERIENTIADALAEVRRKPSLIAVGHCHSCGEAIAPGHLFCDADCRTDWQALQDARKRNGR